MGLRVPGGGARVQRYSQAQVAPDVQRANVVNPQGLSDNSMAEGIQQIGQSAQKLVVENTERANQINAQDASNKLSAAQNELLYNPNTGAFSKRGKNAFGTLESANEQFDKIYGDLDQTMTNSRQKELLRQQYQNNRIAMNRQLQAHISTQSQAYDNEVTESGLRVQQQNVATNPHDNDARTQSLITQRSIIDAHVARNGLPEDARKLLYEDAENKTNLGALTTLVDTKDWAAAKSYYEDVKHTMTGESRTRAERLVNDAVVTGQAQEFTDNVMRKNLPLGEAYKEANQIEDPMQRKATIQMIRDSYSQKKEAEAYNAEQINKRVASQIDRGVLWKDIPQSTKDLLSSSERNALESYATTRMKGNDVPTGSIKYYDLWTMANTPESRNIFMKKNLYTEAYGKIAKSEFDELIKQQTEMKAGTAKAFNQSDEIYSNKQIAEGIAKSNGIYASSDEGGKKQERFTQYMVAVNQGIKTFELKTGKKATATDVQKIADSLVIEKKVNNDWFGSTKMRFEANPDEDITIEFNDIPQVEKSAIQAAARARGVKLSDNDVLKIYLQRLGGN